MAFSPDGKHLGAGDGKGFVHLLDAVGGKTVRKWKAHGEQVLALKYSSNGKVLASSSSDDKICLWNPASGQKLREILPLGRPRQAKRPLGLSAVANIAFVFSPNGKTLAVSSTGRPFVRAVAPAFEMWDIASGEKIALKTPSPSGAVQDLAFSHDGRVLAGLTGSGVIALWDAESGRRLNPDTGDQNPIRQLAVFPDGKRLATRSGNTIHVWNLEGATVEDRIVMPNLQAMALSPDSRQLAAVATFLGSVWDTKTKQMTNIPLRARTQHYGLAYSPDGSKLALLRILEIALVDTKIWSEVWTSDAAGSAGTGQVLFSPDGSFVATPNFQGQIILWNAASGKRLRVLGGPTRTGTGKSRALKGGGGFGGGPLRQIGGFAVSADGRMVAAVTRRGPAFQAGELNLWETATGASRGVIPVPEVQDGRAPARGGFGGGGFGGGGFGGGRVPGAHVAFSADSTLIAYGNRAGTITIVDLATGSPIQQLAGHTDAITGLAFSRDGRRLFSGSDDTTVLIWDLTALPKIGERDAWQILSGDDAAAAYQAMGRLAATPAKTLPELKKCLPDMTNPLMAGRALEVLERIGTPQAQQILEEYAHAGRFTGLREDARAACARLQQHRKDAERSARLIQSLRQAASDHAKDRDGNDLPPGAVARLGTTRYRFINLRPGLGTPVAAFVDDKTLAIGGRGVPIRFVDLTTGNDKRWFRAPWDFAVSANGKTLAAGPSVWDISSGKLLVESPGRRRALALSPDGKTVAVGAQAFADIGKVFLWNTETGDTRQLEGTGTEDRRSAMRLWYSARTFAFSPDGKLVAGIAVPGEIGLWETATAKLLRKWAAPGGTGLATRVGCAVLGFSPGSELVAAHADGTPDAVERVLFWDPRSGKPLRRLNDDKTPIHEAALSVDGRQLATVSAGGISLWVLPSGKLVGKIACPGSPSLLAFSRDGRTLASIGSVLRLWDLQSGKQLNQEAGHPGPVSYVAVSGAGDGIVSLGGGTLIVWDAAGKERRRFGPGIKTAALAPDGKTLAFVNKDLHLWDLASSKEVPGLPATSEDIQGLTFAPGGRVLAVQHGDWFFWDVGSRSLLWKLTRKPEFPEAPTIAFTPYGKHVAVLDAGAASSNNRPIRLRELASGKEVGTLAYASGYVPRMSFSSAGRSLVLDSGWVSRPFAAGSVPLVILEAASGKERLRLTQENGPRALSPDGRLLAVGNARGEIEVLDLPSGATVHGFQESGGRTSALAFSADSRLLFSGGADTSVVVWDLAPQPESSPKAPDTWAVLAGNDAARAYRTMWTLVRAPAQTTKYLRQELSRRHARISPEIAKLISALDSDEFKSREQASAALIKLGAPAELALEQALAKVKSLESRRRIQRLLEKMDGGDSFSPEQIALLRSFEVLERIGSGEARSVLGAFAHQGSGVRLRHAAESAARRLEQYRRATE